MSSISLQYLRRNEIDDTKWNECLSSSLNRLVYGHTNYLDCMSPDWEALVLGDYDFIMPLTWRKKWGIRYLYQPAFVQQLGIFGKQPFSGEMLTAFMRETQKRFRFAEIYLNFQNESSAFVRRQNFILNLDQSYKDIYASYKSDLKNNLRLSQQHALHFGFAEMRDVLKAYKQEYAERHPSIRHADYTAFERLCAQLHKKDSLVLRAATVNGKDNLSAALLIRKYGRMHLIHSVTTRQGRKLKANHFLLDSIVREFAGSAVVLDFEGSDIPGIAHFYSNFGAVNQPYYFWKYNHLPWLHRLFKK